MNALAALPFQSGWRATFVDGGWWGERAMPHASSAYYVCVVAEGLYGLGLGRGRGGTHMPVFPSGSSWTSEGSASGIYPYYSPTGFGFAEELKAKVRSLLSSPNALKPGDYHVSGTGVSLHALPEAKSKVLATLQNGEGVYVMGELETDPTVMLGSNNETLPNNGQDAGIPYAHIGTSRDVGAGWMSAYFLMPGAGNPVKKQSPQQQPQPGSSEGEGEGEGMSMTTKLLLGGAAVVGVVGGTILLAKSMKGRR